MVIQTVYTETLDAGRLGAIADLTNKTLITRVAEVGGHRLWPSCCPKCE